MNNISTMHIKIAFSTTLLAVAILSCNNSTNVKKTAYQGPQNISAPIAEIKAKELIAHGDTRIDNYYWMNDYFKKGPDSSKVVAYLEAENKYYDTMLSATKPLQEKLYI